MACSVTLKGDLQLIRVLAHVETVPGSQGRVSYFQDKLGCASRAWSLHPLCILREEFQGESDAVKIWLEDRTWSLQIRTWSGGRRGWRRASRASESGSRVEISSKMQPVDCSPPCSSVYGILQTQHYWSGCHALLRGSSRPRDWTRVSYASCIGRRVLYHLGRSEAVSSLYLSLSSSRKCFFFFFWSYGPDPWVSTQIFIQ